MTKAKLQTVMGQPIGDRIIVVPTETPTESTGGIAIPDVAREQPQEGLVIAVGPGRFLPDGSRQTLDVVVGDRVLFGKFSGSSVLIADVRVLVMREEECIMRFPKEAPAKSAAKKKVRRGYADGQG